MLLNIGDFLRAAGQFLVSNALVVVGVSASYFLFRMPSVKPLRTALCRLLKNASPIALARAEFLIILIIGVTAVDVIVKPGDNYGAALTGGLSWYTLIMAAKRM